jgi:signal transduction histidine kinase
VVELYDATAEANGVILLVDVDGEPMTLGDKDLLISAVTNLVDNALKYAGATATVRVGAAQDRGTISVVVRCRPRRD